MHPVRKCDPPWLEAISVTPELVYRYQMTVKSLEDILEADMKSLKDIEQVNNCLCQFFYFLSCRWRSFYYFFDDLVAHFEIKMITFL